MAEIFFAGKKRRADWLAAGLLTVLIFVLHIWLWFHAGAFCGDEVNVINLAATHSLPAMQHDSFPVLLPLLVAGWTALGLAGNDFELRALGLLVGGSVIVAFWLAAWSARRAPPLWGLVFFGLNAAAIFWTAYLRAYGLGSLWILLAVAAMCLVLERPTWFRAGVLALLAMLAVQTLYQNAVFVAALCFGGWAVCWRRRDKSAAAKILMAAILSALSVLPYLSTVWRWQVGAASIRPGFSAAAVWDNLDRLLAFPLPLHFWFWILFASALAGFGAVKIFRQRENVRQNGRLSADELTVLAAVFLSSSVLGYLIFLRAAALITSPWYFLPLLAAAAACLDLVPWMEMLPRPVRPAVWGMLIATAIIAVPFALRDLNCRFSNMDCAAARVMQESSAQDYIIVTPWYFGISFQRYFKGASCWDTLPPVADHSTYRFDLVPAAAPERARALEPVFDRITRALQSGHRVWIVGLMDVPTSGQRAATPEGRFIATHAETFGPVDLKLKGQTSDYENVSLLQAFGWRINSP